MTKWYLDDTEIQRGKLHSTPEIYLLGGVITTIEDEAKICREMEKIKEKNRVSHDCPLKYNFKSLKTTYLESHNERDYDILLKSSKIWRQEIIETTMKFDYRIIISVAESFSHEKKKIVEKKPDMTRIIFANGLMRFGLMVKEDSSKKYKFPQVVSDWPSKGDCSVLNSEYAMAFNQGYDSYKNQYYSGALKGLSFGNTVHYTKTIYDPMMQFTDIILGATKEFIECAMNKKNGSFGSDLFEAFSEKFYGYPNILQKGLIVPPQNKDLKQELSKALTNLSLSNNKSLCYN